MAKLPEIVAEINKQLKTVQFADKRFQHAFTGIAELVPKKDGDATTSFASVVSNDGDVVKVGIDDSFPFQIYHRHISGDFGEVPVEDQLGNLEVREMTDQMIMVMIADRDKVKLTKEDIIMGIQLGFPLELGKAFREANTLEDAQIIQGEFSLDKQALWTQEFSGARFSLKPNTIFFSYSYDVLTRVRENCIRICD